MQIDPHIRTFLIPILEEVSHYLHSRVLLEDRPELPEAILPPLNALLAQLFSEAEIAELCTTERSRQDRRRALVRGAGVALLALVEMDRERMQKLREAMAQCPECIPIGPDPEEQEIEACLHTHGLGYLAKGAPMAPAPDGLLVDHGDLRGVDLAEPGRDRTAIIEIDRRTRA